MIEIYRKINKKETLVASVPDDNATLERTLMGADEVTLSVTVSEPLDLRVGDYARLEGSSYTINRAPDLVKASAVEFRYDLVLESPLYNLLDKIYISDVQGLSRFSLSGTLNDFVELLLMNINRDDFDPGWTWATDKGDHPVTVVTETYRFYETEEAALNTAGVERLGEQILTQQLESMVAPYGTISSTLCTSRQRGNALEVTLAAECVEEIAQTVPILTEEPGGSP